MGICPRSVCGLSKATAAVRDTLLSGGEAMECERARKVILPRHCEIVVDALAQTMAVIE
jgi:hypothetical protein